MPRNKKQGLIFTIMMVTAMVYAMSVYNIAINSGQLSYGTFYHALLGLPIVGGFAFLVEYFVVSKVAKQTVKKLLTTEVPPIFAIILTNGLFVMMMAPTMSLFATILNTGIDAQLPLRWLRALMFNLPAALFFQVFYIGPLVRFIFTKLFSNIE